MIADRTRARITGMLMILAGLLGAGGLILLALAAHAASDPQEGRWLHEAGLVALVHAPVVLLLARGRGLPPAGRRLEQWGLVLLATGALVFTATLALRAWLDLSRTHPIAQLTPVGGGLAIAGWLVVAAAGLRVLLGREGDGQARP
ncbi:MAG: DUF423 domain-containing protein [Alphaproteobacteria bacterium]|nr:MAG: DUF423 domain-containing protein [Alphaproteobacteria bacterium]